MQPVRPIASQCQPHVVPATLSNTTSPCCRRHDWIPIWLRNSHATPCELDPCRTTTHVSGRAAWAAEPRGRRPFAAAPPAAVSYGAVISVPEPIPDASSLPEEPSVRSEQIDLTRAIRRCRTWQELRRLYWANRTRHGVVNVVSYFTRLAALLPDLPEVLAAAEDDLEVLPGGSEEAAVAASAATVPGAASTTAGAATEGGGGGGSGGSGSGAGVAVGRGSGGGAAASGAFSPDRRRQHQQQQQLTRQQQQGAPGRRGAAAAAAGPPRLHSLAERAALRQLVVRLVYDACRWVLPLAAAPAAAATAAWGWAVRRFALAHSSPCGELSRAGLLLTVKLHK
ncbi:hypothetical protein PLESTB_001055900 [Pleodorina starrii]|uniref:Uncharacterized protein n=1 Tax=Pleodorina starrii TaxID=330485 RepID=A0A9W6BPW4_9CHLO|nr:hypothetical protein PLESTB_001055900 [Pleodorina starrii]